MNDLITNPLTFWLFNTAQNYLIKFHNHGKHLRIGYLSKIKKCKFGLYNNIDNNVYLSNVELGDFTYVSKGTSISHTKVGKFSSIGPNVNCGLGLHPTHKFVSTHPAFYSTAKQAQITFVEKNFFEEHKLTSIGNDVLIGANTFIIDGINIGDGAIIGAGSVVTKNVSPYAVVAGVPAKIIKQRFAQEDIDFLLSFKWWERGQDWLKQNYNLMRDIGQLKENFKKE